MRELQKTPPASVRKVNRQESGPEKKSADLSPPLWRMIGNQSVRQLLRPGLLRPPVAENGHSLTGLVRRVPFPGETPELEQRRKDAIDAAQNAAQTLERRLRSGALWPPETVQRDRIVFYPDITGQPFS